MKEKLLRFIESLESGQLCDGQLSVLLAGGMDLTGTQEHINSRICGDSNNENCSNQRSCENSVNHLECTNGKLCTHALNEKTCDGKKTGNLFQT